LSRAGTYRAGLAAETVAAWLLRLKGFRVLTRRFGTAVGEIDLIARRGDLLVFVEVKRRSDLASAKEAILPRQRQRIARAAELYLRRQSGPAPARCRFDVVAVAPWRWPLHLPDAWRL
jgi:putative endonuclease